MSDVVKNLKAARELISDPARWTQGEFARNSDSKAVPFSAPEATCWCALGALRKITNRYEPVEWIYLESASTLLFEDRPPAEVNDCFGHAETLRMFDRAIETAEASHVR